MATPVSYNLVTGAGFYACAECGQPAPVKLNGFQMGEPAHECAGCSEAICPECLYFDGQEPDGDGGMFGDDWHRMCWDGVSEQRSYEATIRHEYNISRGV